jgi:hypothetical protein
MGMDPLTIGAGVAGAGAIGGAVKGAKGTPEQVQNQTTQIAPAGAQEQALQQQSLQNYTQAQALASGLEGQTGSAQTFQDQARQAGQNILSGQAMQLTPQEQQQIADLRSALINQGQVDINTQMRTGIQGAQSDAANRGLRGQAMGALQGQVMQAGTDAMGRLSTSANTQSANAAMQMPYQRIAAQQGMIGQGMSLADQLRQQAVTNRMNLQNPALMGMYANERIAGASRQMSTPAQGGGFWDAVTGALGGGVQGANIGANIYGAMNNLDKLKK